MSVPCAQGLGLLINLVEYSARNKYCLMEMEMEGGQGPCNSTVLLSPQRQDVGSSGPLSAIAALVQVCVTSTFPRPPASPPRLLVVRSQRLCFP